MTTWLDKSVPSAVAVSKAASSRKIWGVPTSVTETSRMEGGVGKKIFFVCGFRLVRYIHKMCIYNFGSVFSTNDLMCMRAQLLQSSQKNIQMVNNHVKTCSVSLIIQNYNEVSLHSDQNGHHQKICK